MRRYLDAKLAKTQTLASSLRLELALVAHFALECYGGARLRLQPKQSCTDGSLHHHGAVAEASVQAYLFTYVHCVRCSLLFLSTLSGE